MGPTVLDVLKNVHATKEHNISDEVLKDTIEEFGEGFLTFLVQLTMNLPAEYSGMAEHDFQIFFKMAIEKQRLRDCWKKAMDPNDPLEMFIDRDGNVLFKPLR